MACRLALVTLFGLAHAGSASPPDRKPPPPGTKLPLNPYKPVHGGKTVGAPNVSGSPISLTGAEACDQKAANADRPNVG